jgi:hypothetical protein
MKNIVKALLIHVAHSAQFGLAKDGANLGAVDRKEL